MHLARARASVGATLRVRLRVGLRLRVRVSKAVHAELSQVLHAALVSDVAETEPALRPAQLLPLLH